MRYINVTVLLYKKNMATCQLNLFHIYVCFCAHSFTPNDLSFVRCLYIFTLCRIGVVEFPGDFTKLSVFIKAHAGWIVTSRLTPYQTWIVLIFICDMWYRDICIQTCWLVNNNSSPITLIIVHGKISALHSLKTQVSCGWEMLCELKLKWYTRCWD